ncbi:MAG: flagellar protein FlgN [Desulfobacterales bacterium]|jgi:flagellar biosynthesis/type III secretory pathway chaperone
MERLLKKLIGLLEHTTELYQLLFAVVQNEKNAVVDLDLQQLNEACKAKDNLLLKLRILEEQREQVMVRLAAEIGCSSRGLTLSQLSLWVDESYACRLVDLSRDLLVLIQSLQDASQQNKFLMLHSMQLIQGSYNLLNNIVAANPMYYRSGNLKNTDQTGKLLSGAI